MINPVNSRVYDINIKGHRLSAKITILYLIIGSLWIIFSDRILLVFAEDIQNMAFAEMIKGLLYVAVTSFMIYRLILRDETMYEDAVGEILRSYQELEATYEELTATEEELEQQYDTLEQNEKALKVLEERYRLAIDGANDCIWDWDIKNSDIYMFSRTKRLLGYGEDELEDRFDVWKSLLHPEDADRVMSEIDKHFKGVVPYYETEYRLRAKDGTYKWILSRGKAVFDEEGNPIRMAGSHLDITDRKESEERIFNLAYYDSLTGLPNRAMFGDVLEASVQLAEFRGGRLALIYLDLDDFKNVNDSMGHDSGDELLRVVGLTLKDLLKKNATVARLGEDEFGIIITQVDAADSVVACIERLLEVFRKPWIVKDAEFYITASMGITIYPDDGKDVSRLLQNADLAIYSAKNAGKNCYRFFAMKMQDSIKTKTDMLKKLRYAIDNNQFCLYYQPQIDLENGELVGLEALIRWKHPDEGVILPKDFIPLAEETGLIIPIGEWVLREACRQCREWINKGYKHFSISVNISAKQFQQSNLVDRVISIIDETGIDRRCLTLEITESTALLDINHAVNVLRDLKKAGIEVALDDFGTGYSSLNYLKLLPIGMVKIDQTFMRDIISDANDREIAKTIICLSHKLKLHVTAEGIETEDQIEFLNSNKCDYGQGYFFSRPLPAEDIEGVIKAGKVSMPN